MAKRKTIALALGSGGARGYAHIGVIEEVLARGYDIRAISGCSMGALVGGIHAAGQLDAYRDWVCELDYFDVLRLVDVTWSPMGAIRARRIMEELEALIGDTRIEDLPIPVTTVATDLIAQKEVWFQSGNLLEAIRASIAVPGVITPVQRDRKVLVDGGLMNPLPITPLVAAHVDLVLAVNATAHSPRNQTLEQMLPPADAAEEEAREAALEARGGGFGDWLRGVRRGAERIFSAEKEQTHEDEQGMAFASRWAVFLCHRAMPRASSSRRSSAVMARTNPLRQQRRRQGSPRTAALSSRMSSRRRTTSSLNRSMRMRRSLPGASWT